MHKVRHFEWQKKFYQVFGTILKRERERKGWAIADLANEAHQQFHTVARIEEGKGFSFHNVVWMVRALGLSVDDVLREMAPLTSGYAVSASIANMNEKQMTKIANQRKPHGQEECAEDLI